MKYGWEKRAKKHIVCIEEVMAAFGKHGKYQVVGVSVINRETGGAALIQIIPFQNDSIGADMAEDILGDASRQYSKAASHI